MRVISGVLLFFISVSAGATDINVGQQVFQQKCASCHGEESNLLFTPILHGQEPLYLKNALSKFKSDQRTDHLMGVMGEISKGLNKEEINAVSTYLASKDICEVPQSVDPDKEGFIDEFKAGREIANKQNCMHCHGSFHHMAPRLFGQKKDFLKTTLLAFKSGTRKDRFMNRVSESLSDDDIEKLSTYFNGMILMRHCEE